LINAGAALLVSLPVAAAAPWIMRSYGTGFEVGKWILVCLAFNTVLIASNSVVGQAIASRDRMWIGLLFNGLWAVALVASSIFMVRSGYDALGLALANLIAYLLHTIWQALYLWKTWMPKRSEIAE
jgi:O-antigen/teichoic acid export membrane protein